MMNFKNDMEMIKESANPCLINEVKEKFERVYPDGIRALISWCNMFGLYYIKHTLKEKSVIITLKDMNNDIMTYVFSRTMYGLECKGKLGNN